MYLVFFLFDAVATTEIYTLSLHDALPICAMPTSSAADDERPAPIGSVELTRPLKPTAGRPSSASSASTAAELAELRSEEHTSALQSQLHLVCRLPLEKNNKPRPPRSQNSP